MKRTDAGKPEPEPTCPRPGCGKKTECSHVECPLRKTPTADFTQRCFYTQACCDRPLRIDGVCYNCGDTL